jgi:hypothetical protein
MGEHVLAKLEEIYAQTLSATRETQKTSNATMSTFINTIISQAGKQAQATIKPSASSTVPPPPSEQSPPSGEPTK